MCRRGMSNPAKRDIFDVLIIAGNPVGSGLLLLCGRSESGQALLQMTFNSIVVPINHRCQR